MAEPYHLRVGYIFQRNSILVYKPFMESLYGESRCT